MNFQFSDLSVPSPDKYFLCTHDISSRKWTHLMKLVIMAGNTDAIKLIKEIITNNPEEINKQNEEGWSALIIASINSATCSRVEVVKLLLEAKSNPNLRNNNGCTALMLASTYSNCNSNIETVKLLLKANSNPNLQDNYGQTALMLASRYSSCYSNIETVKLLLEAKSDPNLQATNGRTALYSLLKWGNLEKDIDCTEQLILASQKSIPSNGSFYDIYLTRNVNILNDYYIRILKGEIFVNKTKSARN